MHLTQGRKSSSSGAGRGAGNGTELSQMHDIEMGQEQHTLPMMHLNGTRDRSMTAMVTSPYTFILMGLGQGQGKIQVMG